MQQFKELLDSVKKKSDAESVASGLHNALEDYKKINFAGVETAKDKLLKEMDSKISILKNYEALELDFIRLMKEFKIEQEKNDKLKSELDELSSL